MFEMLPLIRKWGHFIKDNHNFQTWNSVIVQLKYLFTFLNLGIKLDGFQKDLEEKVGVFLQLSVYKI